MALTSSLIGGGGALLGGLLAGLLGGKGTPQAQLSPVGWVQANTSPAMGDFTADTLAAAAADTAPTDWQVKMGDMTLPLNMAARRRAALAAPASATMSSLFGQPAYAPQTAQASSLWDSLLPMAAVLLGKQAGTSAPSWMNLFGSSK